jgi:YesN/AraC family two-component response regulator
MTFTEYLSRVRVEKAKLLLANASTRISQVVRLRMSIFAKKKQIDA